MAKTLRVGLRGIMALSALLLLAGGLTAYATFGLTGTGQVKVTPPTISAQFVSGQVGNKACSVANAGNTLTCPSVTVQAGNSTTLTFEIKNTGSQTTGLNIQVIPDNSTVLSVSPDGGSPTVLAPSSIGSYTYTLYCENVGNAGFTISVTPVQLPPQG